MIHLIKYGFWVLLIPARALTTTVLFANDFSFDMIDRLWTLLGKTKTKTSRVEGRRWHASIAKKERRDESESQKRLKRKRNRLRRPDGKLNEAHRVRLHSKSCVIKHLARMNRSESQKPTQKA